MKNAKQNNTQAVINTEVIEETSLTMKATILTLKKYPTNKEADELFNINDSIVLEF